MTADATELTFTATDWSMAKTVTVTVAAGTAGTTVTIVHPVSGGDYGVNNVTASDVVVTVPESSTPMLSITSNGGVLEDAGSAAFIVKTSAESLKKVTVEFSTTDGTATEGADYTAATGSLTFSPGGALSQTISVSVTDDAVEESDETFDVTLSNPTQATLDGDATTATGMILDNDATTLSVSSDGDVSEGAGSATFTVRLSSASSRTVTVGWSTADGTAKAGADYTAATGSLTFSPGGALSQTIRVSVTDDLVDETDETFDVTLSGAQHAMLDGGASTATVTIRDSDPIPKVWLAHFGRTVAGHVVDAIANRLSGPTNGGLQLVLAGRRLPPARDGAPAPQGAAHRAPGGDGVWTWGGWPSEDGTAPWGGWDGMRSVTPRELLIGSSFRFGGAIDASGRPAWTAWGQTSASRFDGAAEGVAVDGDVTTVVTGADTAWDRWLFGTALAHSVANGSYHDRGARVGTADRGGGRLATTLTSVHPYWRMETLEGRSFWGVLGHGAGELTLTPDSTGNSDRTKVGVNMTMMASGARGTIISATDTSGYELAALTDMQLVHTSSAKAAGAGINLAPARATTSRVRLLLEGAYRVDLGNGRTLMSTLENGIRYDGGDAETGAGIEVGGGLTFADMNLGLTVEANARGLVAHQNAEYSEWGVAGSIHFAPGGGLSLGPSLSVSSSRGAVSGGAARLWEVGDARGLAPDQGFAPAAGLEAEAGWGLAAFDGRGVTTPFAGLSLSEAGNRTWRSGVRWTLGPDVAFGVYGARREAGEDNAAEHEIGFKLIARF